MYPNSNQVDDIMNEFQTVSDSTLMATMLPLSPIRIATRPGTATNRHWMLQSSIFVTQGRLTCEYFLNSHRVSSQSCEHRATDHKCDTMYPFFFLCSKILIKVMNTRTLYAFNSDSNVCQSCKKNIHGNDDVNHGKHNVRKYS